MHSSTCITPLVGGGPRHTPSCRKLRMRVRMTSNMERPQHRRSLVSRSPSRAMAICYKKLKIARLFSKQTNKKKVFLLHKCSKKKNAHKIHHQQEATRNRIKPVSIFADRSELNSLVGFPTSRSEAQGEEEHTLLPASSSSPPDALPLWNTQMQTVRNATQMPPFLSCETKSDPTFRLPLM